ncbi:hypothetical protein V8F33_005311 [Rhypophila sp. PSN 637]
MSVTDGDQEPSSSGTQRQHHHQSPVRQSTMSVTDSNQEPPSSDTQQQLRHPLPSYRPARRPLPGHQGASFLPQWLREEQARQQQTPRPASRLEPKEWRAFELARESEEARADPTNMGILDRAMDRLWSRVLAEPDTYVLSDQEYNLFHFFEWRFRESRDREREIVDGVSRRYWNAFWGV